MIRFIRNSFGKSMVPEEIQDFVAGQIKHIPSEAVSWVGEEVIRRNQKCPEVLHAAILSAWYSWQEQNPDKCAGEPGRETGCEHENCHYGWMAFWARDKDRLYSFVAPCGDCRRLSNTDVPMVTMDRAKSRGWIPDSAEIRKEHDDEIREDVEATREEYRMRGRHRLTGEERTVNAGNI